MVLATIKQWRGNVSGAAGALGIHPNNLRKRLKGLGFDLEALRKGSLQRKVVPPMQPSGTHDTHHNPSAPNDPPAPNGGTGHESSSAIYPKTKRLPTLAGVNATLPDQEIPLVRPKQQPLRLKPEQVDKLREAKFDIAAKARHETDENAILQQFFADEFDDWLQRLLGRSRPPAAPPAEDPENRQ
ncbi:MAG TPA: helix-turn-helix domain-containing protein [Actinomycetes bacterium]|nr:helix-turn-helix domain-containing protein [Actinomycetes bacterium]